jgi:hypothetical protein
MHISEVADGRIFSSPAAPLVMGGRSDTTLFFQHLLLIIYYCPRVAMQAVLF